MFDRFTDRAKKIMAFSRRGALQRGGKVIDTRHILLGLLQEGTGVAAHVLQELGFDLVNERKNTSSRLGPESVEPSDESLPFTPQAGRALELASESAKELGNDYIGSEHLILGLVREGGLAAELMATRGIDYDTIRKEVSLFIGSAD